MHLLSLHRLSLWSQRRPYRENALGECIAMITNAADQAAVENLSEESKACVKELPSSHINVHPIERAVSAAGGSALLLMALRRRSISGLALAIAGGSLFYRGVTGHCSMYKALGIDTNRKKIENEEVWERGIKIEKTIMINASSDQLYRFWRNLENLPRFMSHLKSVKTFGDKLSEWVVEGPAGKEIVWAAEIINERENELIAWKSLPEADVDTAGSVHFEPRNGSTQLRVSLQYRPPAGKLGAKVARLFGEAPEQQIDQDLARFKVMAESGQLAEAAFASR
jgi:uncharacterized membrane protein